MEKRILVYQLLAVALWSTVGLGIFIYAVLSGVNMEFFNTLVGEISLAIINWVFLGFVAVTSIAAGVSIMSLWRWSSQEYFVKRRNAIVEGIFLLVLLVYGTWTLFVS